jgi:undecaprenyl-diphosphatase
MDLGAWYLELRGWLIHHPDAILLGVFLIALIEAVAVIGVIVPAVPLLFVLCVLAAHAEVSLLSLFVAGILGAMLGDGISYALGKGFKKRVHTVWPFSRYPGWLDRSEAFVEKHGGKSIILGRFIGPLRAFVPMAAGIFRMKPLYFLWMNFLSALVWAPTHLLPGYSLGTAAAHAWLPGRPQLIFIAAVLIIVAVLTWLLPVLDAWRQRQAETRPLANAGRALARGGLPEDQRAALRLALFALAGFAVIACLLPFFMDVDQALTAELFSLRQSGLDWLFLTLSLLGDTPGLLVFGAVVMAWLALRGERDAALLVLLAAVLGYTLPSLLKLAFALPRPAWVNAPPLSGSFPSGHAFNAVLVWGLALVMLGRYGSAAVMSVARPVLLSLMLFTVASRPYLGVHWISDVAAGGLLGLACLAGLRWSWYRRPAPGLRLPEMIAILLVALTVSIMAMVVPRLAASVADYSVLPGLLLP